jgi:adenylylsulfate kinase
VTGAGVVVWFTGLPASGKTTLAWRVRDRLAPRVSCVVLDSDELRDALVAHAYADDDREAFYRVLGTLATLLAKQGHTVLVAATAPCRAHRDRARQGSPRFVEVYVRTPRELCETRDAKGLYAQARSGQAANLPGVGVPYEPPLAPDVVADGGLDAAALDLVERLV